MTDRHENLIPVGQRCLRSRAGLYDHVNRCLYPESPPRTRPWAAVGRRNAGQAGTGAV
jgi:hypothetical protein